MLIVWFTSQRKVFNLKMAHKRAETCHQDKLCKNKKGKGKSVPLQDWSGPEGSRKLMFPDFMTTAQGGV